MFESVLSYQTGERLAFQYGQKGTCLVEVCVSNSSYRSDAWGNDVVRSTETRISHAMWKGSALLDGQLRRYPPSNTEEAE